MDPQLTIIVPVYNAEKVLPACLDSLRAQTVPVRICIVDDESTDATTQVAMQASRASLYVELLHLPHGGPGPARRIGATHVQTPYCAFVDADDTLEPEFAASMLATAVAHDADVAFCAYRCIYDGVPRHASFGGAADAVWGTRFPIRNHPELLLSVPAYFWGKIYRTDYFRVHFRFSGEASSYLEDVATMYPFLVDVPSIAKVPEPLYRYAISADSMCHAPRQELARLPALRELHRRFEELGALPAFLPQLHALNRCYLFDQLERLRNYVDPPHQHRVVREYFRHLDSTLPGWRPHPFHPTFHAAYWHAVVTWNAIRKGRRARQRDGRQ